MSTGPIARDERTTMVENSSYRWAYLLMTYGLLAIVGYRGLVLRESEWELMALVVLGGAVTALYQGRHHVLSRHWVALVGTTMLAAGVVGVVLALLL